MDERKDHLWKATPGGEELHELVPAGGVNPLGLDVGTSKIVVAIGKGDTAAQLNAFLMVPSLPSTQHILNRNEVWYFPDGDDLVIYGNDSERFANMLDTDARRPMADGMLNAREPKAITVIDAVLDKMVPRARTPGEVLAFSVPAAPAGREAQLTYHEATLRRLFENRGYRAVAINEGLSVIFSELEQNNFTGVGISCGGGVCNVALAFLSIPSIVFSVPKGGDYIDQSVGAVINKHATRVRVLKEESADLLRAPKDKFERALHIYYEDLVDELVGALRHALNNAQKLPKSERALPIVLSGGTARPRGFKELFERVLRSRPLPIEISEVRLASDPLKATARGALIAARYEK